MGNVTEWVEVDETLYDEEQMSDARGVRVHLNVSPYDIPTDVRGAFDKAKDLFIIDFKYVSDEPTASIRVDEHALALIGRHSRRVYKLELDVHQMNVNIVELKFALDHALNELQSSKTPPGARVGNVGVARKVVNDVWQRVASNMLKTA